MCKKCRECGQPVEAKRSEALFCSSECRKTFNNRRMVRGSELYDIFMAVRYERSEAKRLNLLTVMSNLARSYRDADKAAREGRASWNVKETLARLPMGVGRDGDKR